MSTISAFQSSAFQSSAFQISTVAVQQSDTKGGRIVAGWFTRKKWHNLRKDLEHQRIAEAEAALLADQYEKNLNLTIDSERGWGRKQYDQAVAQRAKAVAETQARKALEAQLAAFERQAEIERVRAGIRKQLDEDERQARAHTGAYSAKFAQQALAQAMMQQRMIEQMQLQQKLIQDELDEEEDMLALLSMH
jgi:hypothetical protein